MTSNNAKVTRIRVFQIYDEVEVSIRDDWRSLTFNCRLVAPLEIHIIGS